MTVSEDEQPAPHRDPVSWSALRSAPADLMIVLPAVSSSASLVRQRTRAWLDALGWPTDDGEDVVMAVNEAVANVVEHTYRGQPLSGSRSRPSPLGFLTLLSRASSSKDVEILNLRTRS